jgi:type IV pilus assembly protein PilV
MTSMTTLTTRAHSRQRAFSLVEVLIALVIMSVGMLGIAGLYVQSMQAGRTSLFRHNAVTLAGDVADRIRANPKAGFAYEGAGGDQGCVATGIDCDQASMAAHDIFQWDQQAVNSLPSGDVTVIFDDTVAPVSYTITISWVEPGETLNYTITVPVMGL